MRGACPPFADVLPSGVYCVRAASCRSCSCLCVCACPMFRVAHHVSRDTSRMQGQIHKPHTGDPGENPTRIRPALAAISGKCPAYFWRTRHHAGDLRSIHHHDDAATTTTTTSEKDWSVALENSIELRHECCQAQSGHQTGFWYEGRRVASEGQHDVDMVI